MNVACIERDISSERLKFVEEIILIYKYSLLPYPVPAQTNTPSYIACSLVRIWSTTLETCQTISMKT